MFPHGIHPILLFFRQVARTWRNVREPAIGVRPPFLALDGFYDCEHGGPDSRGIGDVDGSAGKILDDAMHDVPQLVSVLVNVALAALGGEHLARPTLAQIHMRREALFLAAGLSLRRI